jgi:hypothetical protein
MQPAPVSRWLGALAIQTTLLMAGPVAADTSNPHQTLMQLLSTRSCQNCNLQGADLVHANLRGTNLRGAQLQRANLSQARLDGANLEGANLRFTSLQGASLVGANLQGAQLDGTDLRHADMSGAILSPGALSRTHWSQARGINHQSLSYVELHNAGVDAALAGSFPEAERFFGEAILKQPNAAVSWAGRGISRAKGGDAHGASSDIRRAGELIGETGDTKAALNYLEAANQLGSKSSKSHPKDNGAGIKIIEASITAIQFLVPLAAKILLPLGL